MHSRALSLLAVSLLALLLGGCGNSKKPAAVTTPTTTLSMPVETVLVRAYFIRDGKTGGGGTKDRAHARGWAGVDRSACYRAERSRA